MCNINKYNGNGRAIKPKTLNQFKDALEVCVVACGLNKEFLSHLTFHLNE